MTVGGVADDRIRNVENLTGGNAADTLTGDGKVNVLQGGAGNDTLAGAGGNDTLRGGSGSDMLDGGAGSDWADYSDRTAAIVLTLNGAINAIVTVGGAAEDTVANIENVIGGSSGDTLTGDALANTFRGGGGADTLDGSGGIDTLDWSDKTASLAVTVTNSANWAAVTVGGVIEDTFRNFENYIGGTGDDVFILDGLANLLDGGAGSDIMRGGAGDDTYVVDNAGDKVFENNGEGVDQVNSSVTFDLAGQFVERLTLTGTGNINALGNTLDNTLTGNAGRNLLDGRTGADRMVGGAGDDIYRVDNVGDKVIERDAEGSDLVNSSVSFDLDGQFVEALTLTGSSNVNARGNTLDNILTGNAGDNFLDGRSGADRMTGGAGADTFAFTTALDPSNIDRIIDFDVAADTIRLSRSIFDTITGSGMLSLAQFTANAAGTAMDANDRIIYETDTGKLFFDSNGSAAGGSIQFARLGVGLALTNADFRVV